MRVRKKAANQNYDSLLDTMANVVGILIILLAVTRIGVGNAIDRIHRDAQIEASPDALAYALEEASRIEALLDEMRQRWGSIEQSASLTKADLPRVKEAIAQLRKELDRPGELISISDSYSTHYARQDSLLLEARLERLRQALAELKKEIEQLESRITQLVSEDDFGYDTIRLPDPRPAPEDAEPLLFFCRYGRIHYLDAERFENRLGTGMRAAVGGGLPSSVGDLLKIKEYFSSHDVGDGVLRWKIGLWPKDGGGVLIVAFIEWTDQSAGEAAEEVQRRNSDYQEILHAKKNDAHYLRFLVWGDSFETYLKCRQISESLGFAAGWIGYDNGEEFQIVLNREKSAGSGGKVAKPVD